jgi:hypothetical protein
MLTFKEYIQEHIVKIGDKFRLVSKKTGKNLGTYPTRSGAEKRERQVAYFKHIGEENNIGYEGTAKLLKYRKKMTPGEKSKTPDALPCECEKCQTK